MKLTKARLRQIIKEEISTLQNESAPAGRPHKVRMSSDGRVLLIKDADHPSSYAEPAPVTLEKLYADLNPGEEEWISDEDLQANMELDRA